LPDFRILTQEQPDAHVKHQRRRDQYGHAFQDIAVNAVVEQLEPPRSCDACRYRCTGAQVEHSQTMPGSGFAEVGAERAKHQQSFETFSDENCR
jgi:hypothetical protein